MEEGTSGPPKNKAGPDPGMQGGVAQAAGYVGSGMLSRRLSVEGSQPTASEWGRN